MEFRYPRRLPYLLLILAAGFVLSAILVEPSSASAMRRGAVIAVAVSSALLASLYTFRFSVRVDANFLTVASWSTRRFPLSDIVEVDESTPNLFFGVFSRVAVIRFTGPRRLTLLSYLEGFDDLGGILRRRARLNQLV